MAASPLKRLRQFFASRFTLQDNALWRVMGLLRPFKKQIILANVCMTIASTFSGTALLALYPLLNQTLKPPQTKKHEPVKGQPVLGEPVNSADLPTTSSLPLQTSNTPAAPQSASATDDSATSETETSAKSSKVHLREQILNRLDQYPWFLEKHRAVEQARVDFDTWMGASKGRLVGFYVVFILLLCLLDGGFQFAGDFIMSRASIRVCSDLMRNLYANILRQEMTFFDHNSTGTLLNTCYREVFQMQSMIPLLASRRVMLPVQMLIYFCMLLYISPELSVMLLILLPVIVLPTMLMTRRLKKSLRNEIGQETGALDVMSQGLHGIQAIKAFGAEKLETEQLEPCINDYIHYTQRRRVAQAIIEPLVDMLNMIVLLTVFVLALFVFPEITTAETMLVFLLLITRFYKPLRTIMTMNIQMQRAQTVARHIFHLLDRKPLIADAPDAVAFPADWPELKFDNIDLVYTIPKRRGKLYDREALRGVNVTIKRGDAVALVGPNGAGKSSIVKLVCRLYDPTAGTVLFGGVPLPKIRLADLRDQVCLITQHPVLFNRPISENITFGISGVTQEQVEAAAKAVRAHDFIMRAPQQYDTLIGEGGKLLSGGERQKVVLARAFVRRPSLLIFDEPTAGLDRESVAELIEVIAELRKRGMTIIWITHEHEHLMNVDRVLELTPERRVVEIPWPPAVQSA